jgi:hypothetical protein
MSVGTHEALCGLLQTAPQCALNELALSGSAGLNGIELGSGLLVPPGDALACVRRAHTVQSARTLLTD